MKEIFKKYQLKYFNIYEINKYDEKKYYKINFTNEFIDGNPIFIIDFIYYNMRNYCHKLIYDIKNNYWKICGKDYISLVFKNHLFNINKFLNIIIPQILYFDYKKKNIKYNDNIIYYILGFKKYEIPKEIYELILSFIRVIEINNKLIK